MTKLLTNDGEAAVTLTVEMPLSEAVARVVCEHLRSSIQLNADRGGEVLLDLKGEGGSLSFNWNLEKAQAVLSGLEAKLLQHKRRIADGRPLSKTQVVVRDPEDKEIVKTETVYNY